MGGLKIEGLKLDLKELKVSSSQNESKFESDANSSETVEPDHPFAKLTLQKGPAPLNAIGDVKLADNRRKEDRFDIDNRLMIHGKKGKISAKGFLVNVSNSGFLVNVRSHALSVGDEVLVEILGTSAFGSGTFKCRVVSLNNHDIINESYQKFGLVIVEASPRCIENIRTYTFNSQVEKMKKLAG